MKLSMSMISWYMKDYQPINNISEDEAVIEGFRFLTDDEQSLSLKYVYIGFAASYFSDESYSQGYIIVQGRNYLLFPKGDYLELLNSLLSSFDFFQTWERSLLEATSGGCSLQVFLELCYQVLENPISVGDMYNFMFAMVPSDYAGNDPYWTYMCQNHVPHVAACEDTYYDVDGNLIESFNGQAMLVRNVYKDGKPVLMKFIEQNQEQVATVAILQEHPELTLMNRQLLPLIEKYLVLTSEFNSDRAVIRSGEVVFRGFMEDRIARDSYGQQSCQQLRSYGLPGDFRLMLLQHTTRNDDLQMGFILKTLQKTPLFITPMIYENAIVTLISEAEIEKAKAALKESLRLEQLCIGLSMITADPYSLPVCYRQALFTVNKTNRLAGIYQCEDFAFDVLIESARKLEAAQTLQHPALQQLAAYDRLNGTDLYHSLYMYMECEKNQQLAADRLHVHCNTLKYRLNRIREITELTLEDPAELRFLRLSLWIAGS